MAPDDRFPALVQAFVSDPRGPEAMPLHQEVTRHVHAVSRPYPDAYFALGRKTEDAVEDLGNRVFTVCAAVEKGRFPFSGRTPFRAFTEEQMEGRAMRYHAFYAKISIAREILRDDYARNITRDPVLRWRAELYRKVGEALKACAEPQAVDRGRPPRWSLPASGPRLVRGPEQVVVQLQRAMPADVPTLVRLALQHGGATTQSRLSTMLESVLPAPSVVEPDAGFEAAPDLPTQMTVRASVLAAWEALEEQDRVLLLAVAGGVPYDELVQRDDRFRHKVAVTRAVKRCGTAFVQRVLADLGLPPEVAAAPPRDLIESVLEVLEEVQTETPTHAAGGA